ncbi:MAG: TetR/AcrR family transcriptional regulator [Myxococcota bacterium]
MATARAPRRKPAPPPRTRLDVDERRAQLLALGGTFFTRQAYDEVSIDDVAKAAGISKGLLYHYFPTKRDFYVAVIEQSARRLLEMTRAPDAGSPMDRLRAGLDGYLRYVQENGPAYAALLRGGIGNDAAVGRIVEDTRKRFIKRLLADVGVEQPGPRLRAALRGWLGFVEATAVDHVDHQDVDLGVLREMLVEMLLTAVRFAMTGPQAAGSNGWTPLVAG